MSVQVSAAIEFRCTACWQSNFQPVEAAGDEVACQHCRTELTVPPATPDRVRSAEVLETAATTEAAEPILPSKLTDQQIMQQWQKEQGPLDKRDLSGYPDASCTARLCAHLIDSMFMGILIGIGMVGVAASGQVGLFEMDKGGLDGASPLPLVILSAFVFAGFVVQWILISKRGQTIGKLLTCIRIVTVGGRLPGFVVGVVIRNWVRVLLSLIPFFGLIDILFIFGEEKRCLHDYIAGTRVVQAI